MKSRGGSWHPPYLRKFQLIGRTILLEMVCPLPGWKHGFILKTELTIKNGDIAGIQRGYVMGYNYPSVWLFFNQRYPAAVSSCNSQRAHFLDGSSQRARVSPGTFTNTLWESNIAMENSRNFLKYRCFFLFFEEFLLFIYIYIYIGFSIAMFEPFDYSANLVAFTKQWQQSRQSRHDRRRLSSSKRAWRCLSACE